MARQLQALGRALYGMRAATPEFARVGAPLGFVSTRAFSSAVEGPPANGAPCTRLRLGIQRSALIASLALPQTPQRRRAQIFARRWSAGFRVRARGAALRKLAVPDERARVCFQPTLRGKARLRMRRLLALRRARRLHGQS
jgi:hypothetical protein